MCLADKGSGLPCPQKLSALKELSDEFGKVGKDKVDNIKNVGSKVINIVSNLESQQVEEQVCAHTQILISTICLLIKCYHTIRYFISYEIENI